MNEILIKRVYEAADDSDGCRILVDRLWPRGLSKGKAAIDEWCKDVTPSAELRKWFGHMEERFAEFASRYTDELNGNPYSPEFVGHCSELLRSGNVTLLYAAKNPACNHALVLREWLQKRLLGDR
jgi:uncharacterized protein YeaO (DUF488 family)